MIFQLDSNFKDFIEQLKKYYKINITSINNGHYSFYSRKFDTSLDLNKKTSIGDLHDFFEDMFGISLIFYVSEATTLPMNHKLEDTQIFLETIEYNKTLSGKISRLDKMSTSQTSYADIDQYQRFLEKIIMDIDEPKHVLELKNLLSKLKENNIELFNITLNLIKQYSINNEALNPLISEK